MSPELVQGGGYDGKADVWSIGCIAYELASLQRPFKAPHVAALAMAIATREPEPLPASADPDCPPLRSSASSRSRARAPPPRSC